MTRLNFYGFFRSFLPLFLAFGFLVPGVAAASDYVRVSISTSFLQPLASAHHLESAAQRSVVVPDHTPRPTQGANVMTATDCSMTRSFDGILDNHVPARSAVFGSVGRVA